MLLSPVKAPTLERIFQDFLDFTEGLGHSLWELSVFHTQYI